MNTRILSLIVISILAQCSIPQDPHHTLDNIMQRKYIRAGVSENAPWVKLNGEISGIEVSILKDFSKSLACTIQWISGTESTLLDSLRRFKLDIVISGLTINSIWKGHIGMTRPFAEINDLQFVIAVPPGENEWLMKLEEFLYLKKDSIQKHLHEVFG